MATRQKLATSIEAKGECMSITFDKGYDTNGGANRFWVKDGKLFVWGNGIAGSVQLTDKDSSLLLARMWGGTLLSNGDVGVGDSGFRHLTNPNIVKITTTGDKDIGKDFTVMGGSLNVKPVEGATKTIAATIDFGTNLVGGKEKFGFESYKHALNFLDFLKELKAAGIAIGDFM